MSDKRIGLSEFIAALDKLGVQPGDTVHVQSSLPAVGPVEAGDGRQDILTFYHSGFNAILGERGTLLVHTPFEDYARYGTPFIVEESPSRAGVFSEFVRRLPGAVRSMHPIVSTAGVGPKAAEICEGPHFEGFGWASSWGRMHRANVKFIGLGFGFSRILSFVHYIEACYGVPYQYVKIFTKPVYAAGREVSGPFTMRLRYLDFSIEYDVSRFEKRLLETGVARDVSLGGGRLQMTTAEETFQLGIRCLNEDRYFFLKQPPRFRAGEIPMDGLTGDPRTVYHEPGPNVKSGVARAS